ncbi:TPM domain-containing protein [Clostridium sp. UBA1652]|uniref:TPM domain-containing protein n=1 Tax=Clostridium sp. UBA1652 TaxID=1946348 RepID=UPI00257D8140|nr:TPM domain-containing protein [Clostridium sp. UBA1652]
MRIYIKKIVLLSIFIISYLLLIGYSSTATELPQKPNSEICFQDYAKMFSGDTKNYILNASEDVKNKTTAEVTVVTINSLDGDSIENYAHTLFRFWSIGNREKNNGVLILISKEDRKFRVEVGYGLEGAIPDGKTGTYLRELTTYFKSEKYDEGIITLYNRIIGDIGQEYNVNLSDYTPNISSSPKLKGVSIQRETIISILVFVLLVGSSFIGRGGLGDGRRFRKLDNDEYFGCGFYESGLDGDSDDNFGGDSNSGFGGGDSGGGGASGGW